MPTSIVEMEILETIAQLCGAVEQNLPQWLKVQTPQGFLTMEEEAHALGRRLADGLTAAIVRQRLQDPELAADSVSRAKQTGQYKPNGSRSTQVTLLGGNTIALRTPYMPPVRKRRRKRGQAGLWPVLATLGIWWQTSPALCSEINRQVIDSTSFRDGLAALKRRGICLEYKRTLKLVQRFGRRAVQQRRRWLEHILDPATAAGQCGLAGKTVLVGIDGGRGPREQGPPEHGAHEGRLGVSRHVDHLVSGLRPGRSGRLDDSQKFKLCRHGVLLFLSYN